LFCCGCCGHCPLCLSCWPQQAFSTRKFAPSAASLQGSKGLVPPKWTGRPRRLSLWPARHSPSFVLPCGVVPCSGGSTLVCSRQHLDFGFAFCPRSSTLALTLPWQRLRFWLLDFVLTLRSGASGGGSCMRLPSHGSVSSSRLVSPCIQSANASDLAAVAHSAAPVGSTPAVSSTRGPGLGSPCDWHPPLVRACQHPRVRLFLLPCPRLSMQAQDCQGLWGHHHGVLVSRPMLMPP